MFDESGGTEQQRRDEACKLLVIIRENLERLSQRDIDLINDVQARLRRFGDKTTISLRTLFWLRDIRDRSL